MSVAVTYRTGDADVLLELQGDPFDVCNAVAARLGLELIDPDPTFGAVMRRRKEISTAAQAARR